MDDGQMEAALAALPPDKAKEVTDLNLHPGQQATLVQVLTNSPELTIQEALDHLKAAGGI